MDRSVRVLPASSGRLLGPRQVAILCFCASLSVSCARASSRGPQASSAQESTSSENVSPHGSLDPKLIQKTVRAYFKEFRQCYESGLKRNPTLSGKISIRFIIGTDGRVSSASVVPKSPFKAKSKPEADATTEADATAEAPTPNQPEPPVLPDKRVTDCVVAKFPRMQFPKPTGGPVTVTYPIVLIPGD
jgi:hypothetical protein